MAETRWQHLDRIRATGELLGRISHELNNPIAGILGYAHLAAVERDPEKLAGFLDLIRSQAERCRDVVARVQDCASIPKPRKAVFGASALVAGAVALHKARLDELRIGLEQSAGAGQELELVGDLQLLLRVLDRLIENACTALVGHPGPRRVVLRAWREGERVLIEVKDSGPGIPRDLRERVFDPTYTSRKTGRGLGLGLVHALSIMEAHGGDIFVADGTGPGAAMRIAVPAAWPLDQVEADGSPAAPAVGPLVLCVDDDVFVRELCQELVRALGGRCVAAPDVPSAVEVLRENAEINLVICDFWLPNGLTAEDFHGAAMSSRPDLRERFVITSGDTGHDRVRNAVARLGTGHFSKPFALAEMEDLLARYGFR